MKTNGKNKKSICIPGYKQSVENTGQKKKKKLYNT